MPEVAPSVVEEGAIVLTLAGTAIGAKRASGAVDIVVFWNAASGNLTIQAPTGTDAGGGTRRLVVAANGLDIGAAWQTTALVRTRVAGNSYEFGHPDAAGYGSTLGAEASTGSPFLALAAEAGTTNNTYRTRGLKPGIFRWNAITSVFEWGTVASINADNQAFQSLLSLTSVGTMTLAGSMSVIGTFSAGATTIGAALSVAGAATFSVGIAAGTLTLAAGAGPVINHAPGATTNAVWAIFQNTGGSVIIGVEGVAPGTIISGTSAYQACIRGGAGLAFSGTSGGSIHMSISTTGIVTVNGTLSVLGPLATSTGAAIGGLVTAGGGVLITGGGFQAGAIYKDANYGFVIAGVAGAIDQFSVFDTGGTNQLIHVNIGSTAVRFAGQIFPGTLSVFAPGTIGVYTNYGLVLQAKTGVNYDFSIMNNGSSILILANPTGSPDLLFGGKIIASALGVGPSGPAGTFYRASAAANSAVMVV